MIDSESLEIRWVLIFSNLIIFPHLCYLCNIAQVYVQYYTISIIYPIDKFYKDSIFLLPSQLQYGKLSMMERTNDTCPRQPRTR